MRRKFAVKKKQRKFWITVALPGVVLIFLAGCINTYINAEIRPTLMQLAEYEARSSTLKIMHTAVDDVLSTWKTEDLDLCLVTEEKLLLDASKANRLRNTLIASVQAAMDQAPEREYSIPFGSLTGNSLLSGHGPEWTVQWQPQGYVQGNWQERCESVSINTSRYSADLTISVTVNMILDGRTETLTVADTIPLICVLLRGETPVVYGALSD